MILSVTIFIICGISVLFKQLCKRPIITILAARYQKLKSTRTVLLFAILFFKHNQRTQIPSNSVPLNKRFAKQCFKKYIAHAYSRLLNKFMQKL